jgi:hypothetical protein
MSGLKLTGWLAIGAGVAFFAADAYLFGVMGPAGFTIDMFDLPGKFLPWLFDHQTMYQGLSSLYFVSQALLLLVPWRLGEALRVRTGRRPWWTVTVLGGWTLVVAAWKLFDPQMPLEDWLGFLLGAGYVGLGVALLRTRLPVQSSVPAATRPDLEAAGAGP